MKHTICLVLGSVLLVAGMKILSEVQALVAGRPTCLVSLPALSACLLCFLPATSAHSLKWIFAAATNSTITQDRASGTCQ
jgi:hypothetical protein